MTNSIYNPAVQAALVQARAGQPAGALFPSPADWRDEWIYFLMLDRFNNPTDPPSQMPFDVSFGGFQGGKYQGVIDKLDYIKGLGAGALWLSPVIKNCQFDPSMYHGYGFQNFLAAEPRFATNPARADDELRALVDAAHEAGLYVIFDIVLHHAGDVFAYPTPDGSGGTTENSTLGFQSAPQTIHWRDDTGAANPAWSAAPANPPLEAAVWPTELRSNNAFTRQGMADTFSGANPQADFDSLKAIASHLPENGAVRDTLIRAYQFLIARFDVDAFRIDTLKFVTPDFERTFGNAIREFALSAGKKNFFTFGEIATSDDRVIAAFIGRNTTSVDAPVGVDAALDFPLAGILPAAVKGLGGARPVDLAQMYETRKAVESGILTSHGEAGKFFVTFLDNHDQCARFGYTGPIQLTNQIILGLACLLTLQGVPCLYYGTEQGLSGHKPDCAHSDDSLVREALWGKKDDEGRPNGFDTTNPLYQAIRQIAAVRARQPALRYGRQYFRPISGNGTLFSISTFSPGVIAFSRILNDQEVVVAANAGASGFQGQILVDSSLSPAGAAYQVLYSNLAGAAPGPVTTTATAITIQNADGTVTSGPACALPVTLVPGEVQILAQ